ncbi:MAG: peptide deformylase, partial [Saprospiraceae bacterium]|nr:peptide deformylase [Saprospiraceae bacterium]
MAVREVLRMGDPRLLRISAPWGPSRDEQFANLVNDMFDTMAALDGAGLAAPQIGVMKRVVIFEVADNPRYPEAASVPRTILVDPEIEPLTDEMEAGWEGCLSVPGMRGLVQRYTRVRYRGHDENGKAIDREVTGFHARVVQHEVDHLDGVLYPMRIQDLRNFGFEKELFSGSL